MKKNSFKIFVALGGSVLVALWFLASAFDAPPSTQTILDRHQNIIASINPAHQGFEYWLPLHDIPSTIINATLNKEDRYFRAHPGINPLALIKALGANLSARNILRGGSTLTQQLAKMILQDHSRQLRSRTLANKMTEAALALGLELKHSKNWILERYLNTAYYGQRCYGIAAAARYYFDKNLSALTTSEINLLVQLPQNPSRAARLIPQPLGQRRMGTARHFAQWSAQKYPGHNVIKTTLDLPTQKHLEEAARLLGENKDQPDPLLNMAIVVIDVPTGQLRAMVGSRDYFNASIDGAYNAALALRQPGSALKPFTYFLAFSRGYTPDSLVDDEPHSFTNAADPAATAYVPQNFDQKFHGQLSFRAALANSYNVPAVALLNQLGIADYLELLHQFGLTELNQAPQHYGLSLTLGSGEVSLLDLTNAYAALARGGRYLDYSIQQNSTDQKAREIIPEAAKYAALVTDILSDTQARVPAFGFNEDLLVEGFSTAVKTGTSYNHHDNWAIGYNDDFAVGVWVGHSDNTPLNQTTGASGAGPIWHAAMEHILRRNTASPIKNRLSQKSLAQKAPQKKRDLIENPTWQIISPLANNFYRLKPYLPSQHQQILAKISGRTPPQAQWILDGVVLGETADNQFWIAPTKGDHILEVVSLTESRKVRFHVEEDS